MKKQNPHVSIQLIYWTTSILYWIFSIIAVAGIVVAIGILFNAFSDNLNLHVSLPTSFNVMEKGQLVLSETTTNVTLVEATGKINFTETPGQLRIIYGIFMILVLAISFYSFYMFRKFITNVYRSRIFIKSNIQYLKKISYGLLIFWGLIVIYTIIQHTIITKNLIFNSIEMSGNIQFHPIILVVALFLWVLSHIFMHGSQLEEEANLTI